MATVVASQKARQRPPVARRWIGMIPSGWVRGAHTTPPTCTHTHTPPQPQHHHHPHHQGKHWPPLQCFLARHDCLQGKAAINREAVAGAAGSAAAGSRRGAEIQDDLKSCTAAAVAGHAGLGSADAPWRRPPRSQMQKDAAVRASSGQRLEGTCEAGQAELMCFDV